MSGKTFHLRDRRTVAAWLRETLSCFVREERLPSLPPDIDPRLAREAVRSRNLGPLLGSCPQDSSIPEQTREQWRRERMNTMLRTMAAVKTAAAVTKTAAKAGVAVAAMRGAVLAQTLYPDPGARPMHDVDLLIRPEDRQAFLAAMAARGHHPAEHLRSQYVFSLNRVTVEVHWQLLSNKRYRDRLDSGVLVGSARPLPTPAGDLYRLDDRWELIGMVLHAFTHHNLGQIYSLVDIGLFMRNKKDFDWSEIARWSRENSIGRMMALTLGFVDHLFGLGMEERILSQFDAEIRQVARCYPPYLEQALDRITPASHLALKRSQFLVAESIGGKGRELLRLFSRRELRFVFDLLTGGPRTTGH
ncbi:MAG: hypothetical protein Kow0089_10200 [Desulfobulbaceae bacterium]